MLFGTFTCSEEGGEKCNSDDLRQNTALPSALFLTLQGNIFIGTAQRHPRIFGRVFAHVVNNVIAFRSYPRPDGTHSDSYGTFVSNGAHALIEGNIFLPLDNRPHARAVWTTSTPNAMRMPWDVDGFMRTRNNQSTPGAILDEHEPEFVQSPSYSLSPLNLNQLGIEHAIACIAADAGRNGSVASELCRIRP